MPTARAAKVQLLIDRDAAAGVLLERSRAHGVVTGLGSARELGFEAGLVRLNYVPGSADVKPGDRLVTSGIDGIYPKGLPVGEIQSAERAGGEWRIRVKPAVDFATLEAVLVVLKAPETPPETPGDGEQ